jgi:hypothetical protein
MVPIALAKMSLIHNFPEIRRARVSFTFFNWPALGPAFSQTTTTRPADFAGAV